MKKYDSHNILQELNSISRMAIIENALVTEKMISIYSQILKYSWQGEEARKVTADKEMNLVIKYCEFFQLKNNGLLQYDYIEHYDLKSVFIPHYTMVPCIRKILETYNDLGEACHIQIESKEQQERVQIIFGLESKVKFQSLLDRILQGDREEKQVLEDAIMKWQDCFGKETFRIEESSVSQGKTRLCFECH